LYGTIGPCHCGVRLHRWLLAFALVAAACERPAPTRPAAIADRAWVWIWVGDQRLLAFTYRDPTAGPSANRGPVPPGSEAAVIVAAVERPSHTVRIVEGA
jgi:hypothetical protein